MSSHWAIELRSVCKRVESVSKVLGSRVRVRLRSVLWLGLGLLGPVRLGSRPVGLQSGSHEHYLKHNP